MSACGLAAEDIPRVSVDARMELLSVVQWLADDPILKKNDPDPIWVSYHRSLRRHFGSHKQHRVVRLALELRSAGLSYGRIPELALRLAGDLTLRSDAPEVEDYLRKTRLKRAALDEFLKELAAFRRDARFDDFYAQQAPCYARWIERTRAILTKTRAMSELVGFFGYEPASCDVVIYPLANGGFAERLPAPNGRAASYVFTGVPAKDIDLVRLVIHEIGHSYTGPLAYETHAAALRKHSRLFAPIEKGMRRQNYHDWINCVDEHVNRAVVARLLQRIYGGVAGETELDACVRRDFAYIRAIHNRLAIYEKQRDKYPTFIDFYPEIVAVFANLDV